MTGTLNIWSDGGDDNYHIGIYQDYQITYGVDGSGGWTKVEVLANGFCSDRGFPVHQRLFLPVREWRAIHAQ